MEALENDYTNLYAPSPQFIPEALPPPGPELTASTHLALRFRTLRSCSASS